MSRLSDIYRANLEASGVTTIESRAEIAGPNMVRLADGRVMRARHIAIATGGAPERAPAIPGLDHAITSNEIFDLATFPQRLLVVGGGYIAVEFASLFASLGADVTAGDARRQCSARLRRGHARGPARRAGSCRHRPRLRPSADPHRKAATMARPSRTSASAQRSISGRRRGAARL